jgi:hypothetical protein
MTEPVTEDGLVQRAIDEIVRIEGERENGPFVFSYAAVEQGIRAALNTEPARSGEELRAKYDELIFAVGIKHPNETRHQTALRYIQRAETGGSDEAKAALSTPLEARDDVK